MNEEKIARLEGLLERVRARAAMPRRPAAPAPAVFDSAAVPTGGLGLPSESVAVTAELPTGNLAASSQVLGFDGVGVEAPTGRVSTVPPRVDVPEPEPSSIEVSASELTDAEASDVELEVEVSSEVVEVDVDVEVSEPEIPVARKDFESGAQRVVASAAFDAEEHATSDVAVTHESFAESEPLEAVAPVAPANEIGEEPPLSSRRPVVASEPPVEAYPSAPRHTPPPESGKQVAASSVPVGRIPSAPAPSGEEAFVSGWREPGLASQPPREAAAPLSTRAEARPERAEIIEPVLPADAHVARVEGVAPAFAPRSFGELLDATLAL